MPLLPLSVPSPLPHSSFPSFFPSLTSQSSHKLIPPQWVNCDIRILDMNALGKFSVIMADPPWDIHMELPYGLWNLIILFNVPRNAFAAYVQ